MGHALVDEVDLLDRHLERLRAPRARDLVFAHLALLPQAKRKLHLAGAAARGIARVVHPAQAGAVGSQREELALVAIHPLVDLVAVPADRAVDGFVAAR